MRFVVALFVLLAVVLPALAETRPGFLGVEMRDLTKEEADAIGFETPTGVWVVKPVPGGPADKAGLTAGDVILSVDGVEVENSATFRAAVGAKRAGTDARFRLIRAGRNKALTVTLAERPAEPKGPSPLKLMLDTGGHRALIKGLAFTPDGRQMVTAGDDKVIRVWDVALGQTVRAIHGEVGEGEAGKVFTLALSPDGRWLAVGGMFHNSDPALGSQIRLYDFASGRLVRLLKGHENVVHALAFSPDGTRLVSGSADRNAIVWDIDADKAGAAAGGSASGPGATTGTPLRRLAGHTAEIYAVGFADGGRTVVTGSYDTTLKLWDAGDGGLRHTLTGHGDKVFRLAIDPTGRRIASGDRSGEIRLWDARTGRPLTPTLPPKGRGGKSGVLANQGSVIGALAFSPDGTRLLTGNGRGTVVHIFDAATGATLATYTGHDNVVIAAGWHPDGRRVATAGGDAHAIHIWPAPAAGAAASDAPIAAERVMAGGGKPAWATGFAADGSAIAWGTTWQASPGGTGHSSETGSPLEHTLRLPAAGRDLGTPARRGAPPLEHPARDLSLDPGLGGTKGGVSKGLRPLAGFGAEPRKAERESQRRGGADAANGDWLRASPSQGAFTLRHAKGGAYGYDAILEVVDAGRVVARLERGPTDGFAHRSYSFTPDGRTLVSGGSNGHLQTFDLAAVVAAARDAPDRTLKGAAIKALARPLVGHEGDVWAVTPSPDGRLLVSGAADQTVRLWNLATGQLIVSLLHLPASGDWLMWTPQGYYTGSEGADRLIGWQVNKGADQTPEFSAASQLRRQFDRPDIVTEAIRLASAEAAIAQARGTDFKLDDVIRRPPPRLSILSPRDGARLSGGTVPVTIRLDATPDPTKRLALRVNGTAITDLTPDTAGGEIEFKVPLASGENVITVTAGNEVGETVAEVRVTHDGEGPLDKRGTLYVIAIGVDAYPGLGKACGKDGKESCDLAYSGRDALLFTEAMRVTLGRAHKAVDVALLTNLGQPGHVPPTASAIRSALSRVRNLATETDTVVLFTAGHGHNDGSDYLLLATDVARQGKGFDGNSVIPWVELERLLFGTPGRRFLFVDTCHSGGAYHARLGNEAYHNDVTALSASGQDEQSLEFGALSHGLFSYAMAEGLVGKAAEADADKDRQVKVSELAKFLSQRTGELIAQHWPGYEKETGLKRPVPKLYRARDARDHVLAKVE